jgi:hypothetical protein
MFGTAAIYKDVTHSGANAFDSHNTHPFNAVAIAITMLALHVSQTTKGAKPCSSRHSH